MNFLTTYATSNYAKNCQDKAMPVIASPDFPLKASNKVIFEHNFFLGKKFMIINKVHHRPGEIFLMFSQS